MALDTLIPLSVKTPDLASPLANFVDMRMGQQDRQREIGRQQRQDAMRETEFNQNQELRTAEIKQFIDSQTTQQYLQDSLTVKNLLESGSVRDAAIVAKSMQEKYKGTDYESGLDGDFQNIVAGNIEPVLQGIDSEIKTFQQMQAIVSGRAPDKATPYTNQGKLKADYDAGLIGKADYDAGIAALSKPETPSASVTPYTDIGRLNLDFARGLVGQADYDREIDNIIATQEANAAKASTTSEQAQTSQNLAQMEAQRIFELTDKLAKNEQGLKGATGPISSRMPSFREGTVDFEADIGELQSLLTMGNLGRMTGVLSESDIKLIREAASGINMAASEGRMREKIKQIRDTIATRFGFTEPAPAPAESEQPFSADIFSQADAIVGRGSM